MQLGALRDRHLNGLTDRPCEILDVERVDHHAARAERLRRACELGEDQHARPHVRVFILARHILVGHQIHTVTQRGDDACARDGVESHHLIKLDRLVQVMDRSPAWGAEFAIDAPDETVSNCSHFLVFDHLSSSGHSDLQEDDLAHQIRPPQEQRLHRQQLLRDTLRVVGPIDAE